MRYSVLVVEQALRQDLLDDFLDAELLDLACFTSAACWVEMTTLEMRDGLAVLVYDGDLDLGVGPQPRHFAGLADLGELAGRGGGRT